MDDKKVLNHTKGRKMPTVTFSEQDILAGKKLNTDWYKYRVKSVSEGKGKKDPDSITYTVQVVGLTGAATNVPITTWFSEKMLGPLIEFVGCFGTVKPSEKVELSNYVGKDFMGYTSYDTVAKRNVISEFKTA